jgi:2-keto-3-deoxy-L-arabinonate dehydratase
MEEYARPRGVFPMLYAFFDERGALDRRAFRQQVEAVVASGAHGVAVLGLMTEVGALSAAERRTLVDWAVEDVAGRAPLMATIAGSNLNETVALARAAESAGADMLIVQPPLDARPDERELADYFSSAMRATALPTGIQNAPDYLGVGLGPDSVERLALAHDNFVLMKAEGAVAVVKPYIDLLGRTLAIFNGRGGLELTDNLRAGAAGIVPVPDCADVQAAIFDAWQAGDEARMDALYETILPYVVFAMQTLTVAIVCGKRMFARRAGIENACSCRIARDPPEPFFDDGMRRWSARFGAYGQAAEVIMTPLPPAPPRPA